MYDIVAGLIIAFKSNHEYANKDGLTFHTKFPETIFELHEYYVTRWNKQICMRLSIVIL